MPEQEKAPSPGWMMMAGVMIFLMFGGLVLYKGCAEWKPGAKSPPTAVTTTQTPPATVAATTPQSGSFPQGQLPSRREGETPVEPFDSSPPADAGAMTTTTTMPPASDGMATHIR